MAGAMNKIFAEAGLLDMGANCPIYFPSRDLTSSRDRILYGAYADIARLSDDPEYLADSIRRWFAYRSCPGNVVVHGARSVFLSPHIQQDEIAFADRRGTLCLRLVVRIAAMGVHRDNGRVVGNQIFAGESFHEPLLDVTLRRASVADTPPNFLKRGCGDGVNRITRGKMSPDLFIRPCGFELGHQVTGADHVLAQPANHFQRAAIH